MRARLAVGMFERVAGTAGASRVMQAWPGGVQADAGSHISCSTQVGGELGGHTAYSRCRSIPKNSTTSLPAMPSCTKYAPLS